MTLPALGTALLTWIVAIAAPGPDIFQILRVGSRNRRAGVCCALGIMVGNSAWIILSLAGLSALVKAYPVILAGLKIIGGGVLLWMGWASFRGGIRSRGRVRAAGRDAAGSGVSGKGAGEMAGISGSAAVRLGILTNLSNPKALLFFGAVFANFVDPGMGVGASALLAGLFIVVGLVWFTGVALLVSLAAPLVARHSWAIDVFSGVLFMGIGLVMLLSVAGHAGLR